MNELLVTDKKENVIEVVIHTLGRTGPGSESFFRHI